MKLGARLNIALCWLADRSVIGFLTCLVALPVLSAPAAFAAGAAAVREDALMAALPTFWRTFRHQFRPGLGAGAVLAGLLSSIVVATVWATEATDMVEQTAAMVVCLQASVASATVLVFSATVLDLQSPITVRNVLAVVLALPGVFALTVLLLVVTLVAAGVAPILALPLVGTIVQVIAGNKLKYRRQASQREA